MSCPVARSGPRVGLFWQLASCMSMHVKPFYCCINVFGSSWIRRHRLPGCFVALPCEALLLLYFAYASFGSKFMSTILF
ncbi:hypothetical protein V1522DRAFT_414297 [Lipomyces starkeyi]